MQSFIRLAFTILCTVPFIMVLGNSMLIPILPEIKAHLGLTLTQVGLLITAFSVPAGLTIPLAGLLSDHYGRKTIMVPALVVYGLGGLVSGTAAWLLSQPYSWMLAGRIIQGLGAGGTYQLAMALTGDIFTTQERTRALGLLEASNGLGKVVSPIAGSALALLVWFAPFFAYGLLAIPLALAVAWLVPEHLEEKRKTRLDLGAYFRSVGDIFRTRGSALVSCFLAGMFALLILFGVLSYTSDILRLRYGITGFASGLLIAIPVGLMALTSYLAAGHLKENENHLREVVITGLALLSAALVTIGVVTNIYLLFIALSVMGTSTGIILPAVNTLITGAAETRERGIITCLYGAMRFFGVAIGPPAFGLVASIGRLPTFILAGLAVAAVACLAFTWLHERVLLPPRPA